jgi:hypothetical protein
MQSDPRCRNGCCAADCPFQEPNRIARCPKEKILVKVKIRHRQRRTFVIYMRPPGPARLKTFYTSTGAIGGA